MATIGIVGCIHGDIENLMRFIDMMSSFKISTIVCPGDFTDTLIPKGFTRVDIGKIIVEELGALSKNIVTVPGSWDKEIVDFLKRNTISVHAEGKIVDGVGFYGYGGAKTPFNTPFEPSEGEMELGLEKAYSELKGAKLKIQVTHAPPNGTKLDKISSGAHVGSNAVRSFIETKHPDAAISAHIHESRGVDELESTKLINPGRFPEGYAGLIEINDSRMTTKVVSLI